MAYFERLDDAAAGNPAGGRFAATDAVSGAWDPRTQHIAPALGLLAHEVERDHAARREDGLQVGRLSYDILGTVPVGVCSVAVETLRSGRTIELVEARLVHDGRDVVRLRAWWVERRDTRSVAGTAIAPLPPPDEMAPWDAAMLWPGGFIATAEVRRRQVAPGRAQFWARTSTPLLDEPIGDLARVAGLLDIANGMTVREQPDRVAFPNLDLTAHLFAAPRGEWVGFDTTVSFGPSGLGLTSSVVHDEHGPFGTVAQVLTVRPGP